MTRVWSNGCFDGGLHYGHLQLLKYAKSLGDKLICGIDSDSRVRQTKGEGRPLRSHVERSGDLYNTGLISAVFIFDSDQQLIDTIQLVKPDIMVIGIEYKDKKIIGLEYVKEIIFFERIEGYSTTEIINKNGNNSR